MNNEEIDKMAKVQKAILTEYTNDGSVVMSNIRKGKADLPVIGNNETYSATLVTEWYDGSPMDDSKADGAVYLKYKGTEYPNYTGSYFRVNLPNFGELFLEKDTVSQMRALSSTEVLLLKMGYYKGVTLNGYYKANDTPTPIQYYLSDTEEEDDGGSVFEVGGIKLEHEFKLLDFTYFGSSELIEDNSQYIQKAINYVLSNSGVSLDLSANKTYTVKEQILVNGSIEIEGRGCKIKALTPLNKDLLLFTEDYNRVSNLHVEGIFIGTQIGDMVFRGSNYNRITDCNFVGLSASGILFDNSNGNIVTGCRFEDKAFGINLRQSSNNTINSNYFTRGYRKGVVLPNGGGYTTVPLGDGIKMTSGLPTSGNIKGGLKTIISNNIFDNVYRDGADLFTDGEDIIFTNNFLKSTEALGLDIKTIYYPPESGEGTSIEDIRQTANLIITGNHFEDTGLTTDGAGVSITSADLREGESPTVAKGVHNVIISNNQFIRGYRSGIIMMYCKNVNIHSNNFIDIPYNNIHFKNEVANVNIGSNVFQCSTTDSIPIYGSASSNTNKVKINNNIMNGGGALYGILLYGKNLDFNNNTIDGFTRAIMLDNALGVKINENIITNSSVAGVEFGTVSANTVILSNNYIENTPRGIIYRASVVDVVSISNTFKGISVTSESNSNLATNYQTNGQFLIL